MDNNNYPGLFSLGDNKPDFSGPAFEVELNGNIHNVSVAIYMQKQKKVAEVTIMYT